MSTARITSPTSTTYSGSSTPNLTSKAGTGTGTPNGAGAAAAAKAMNVFSNDGSFLERFYRTKREEEEKKKQAEILTTKRTFENRFRNRGKRSNLSSDDPSGTPTSRSPSAPFQAQPRDRDRNSSEEPSSKRQRTEVNGDSKSMTKYEQEVLKSTPHQLLRKDQGTGVRPMIK